MVLAVGSDPSGGHLAREACGGLGGRPGAARIEREAAPFEVLVGQMREVCRAHAGGVDVDCLGRDVPEGDTPVARALHDNNAERWRGKPYAAQVQGVERHQPLAGQDDMHAACGNTGDQPEIDGLSAEVVAVTLVAQGVTEFDPSVEPNRGAV